jgi:hypothetical protein
LQQQQQQQQQNDDDQVLSLCYQITAQLVNRLPNADCTTRLIDCIRQSIDNGPMSVMQACRLLIAIIKYGDDGDFPLELSQSIPQISRRLLVHWPSAPTDLRHLISNHALPALLPLCTNQSTIIGDNILHMIIQSAWPYVCGQCIQSEAAVDAMHLLVSCFPHLPIRQSLMPASGSAGDISEFTLLLQYALVSRQPVQHQFIQKAALLTVKRIVDMSAAAADQLAGGPQSQQFWTEWIFIFETIQECSMHLIDVCVIYVKHSAF